MRSIILGIIFTLQTVGTFAAPVFLNNSFESGSTSWTLGGSPDIQGFGFDGSQSMAGAVFAGGGSFETISQSVAGFVLGQSYELSFYQQNNGSLLNPYDDGRASWQVFIDGGSEFFSALMDPGDTVWQQQSFVFVASSTSLTFLFSPFDIDNGAALPGDTGVYPVIDLIEISEVPLPAAAWLFITALGGLVVAKRKKI